MTSIEREWQQIEDFLRERNVKPSIITIARATFLVGLHVATQRALRGSISIVNMSAELRGLLEKYQRAA